MAVTIAENLARVHDAIARACEDSGRDAHEVDLLPVTKTQPSSVLDEAIAAGCDHFGENRVQEMVTKASQLSGVAWTMIGHLQRNKVRAACRVMDHLQSLDSLNLAQALEEEYSTNYPDRALDVLVEVNTSGESTKHGVGVDEVVEFTRALRAYPHLHPTGLMTVADPDPGRAEQCFVQMVSLQRQLRDRDGQGWDELSMGMSTDFEAAIAHGSTCVRIGTAIFGPR